MRELPWLPRLYLSRFWQLAEQAIGEPVAAAKDERYGAVINVQRGTRMRFECHVDSNPLTGLLFCSDHAFGAGGELIFAHDQRAASRAGIERSRCVIRLQSGHLIFFDGWYHSHYAGPLTPGSDTRIVAVMNYNTRSCPESTRPKELIRHLFDEQYRACDVGVGRRLRPVP